MPANAGQEADHPGDAAAQPQGARSPAARAVIAGANLKYQPVDLSKQANQYRDEKGWFGDKAVHLRRPADRPADLRGRAVPGLRLPDLAGADGRDARRAGRPEQARRREIRGIPVNRKADALFFLHAARIDQPPQRAGGQGEEAVRDGPLRRHLRRRPDGERPDLAEIDVDDYRQKTPAALPGAQIAWTRPYEGTDFSAVAYAKQWNNPRPTSRSRASTWCTGSRSAACRCCWRSPPRRTSSIRPDG